MVDVTFNRIEQIQMNKIDVINYMFNVSLSNYTIDSLISSDLMKIGLVEDE